MAQTKKKRRRKHRGTPAGTVEARGRTSKPPPDVKRRPQSSGSKSGAGPTARDRRQARFDEPPTWRGSLNRAGFAAAILVIFVAVVQRNLIAAVVLGAFALIIYVPMSYYTDLALYRRRQRKKRSSG